jgi:hypothetical protein
MSALYPRGNLQKLALCLCLQVRGSFPSPFLLSLFLLARGLLTYLSLPPGLATQKDCPSFSELVLDAKLAFSILHKVQGTMATCLGEEPSPLPGLLLASWGYGQGNGQRSVYGLAQFPVIKLSLTAAYLWFPHCPCCPHSQHELLC